MAIVVDCIDVTGMRKSDFELLEHIIAQYRESGTYFGRKDWHDKRVERLGAWAAGINKALESDSIKLPKPKNP